MAGQIALGQGVAAAARLDIRTAANRFEAAATLLPLQGDIALLAAQSLAGAAADGDRASAAACLQWSDRALARLPHSTEAAQAKEAALNGLGRSAEAKAVMDEALDHAPDNYLLHVQRAVARFGLRDVSGAIADLQTATRLAPHSPLPWAVLARIHRLTGDRAAASAAA
jgi:predicted Zn-dependent protease